eukprot:TRINITY_DN1780_c0_g3_i6.p1 TRINITY_DN1780_c0_g3~~TRINITY_DN1780_c0_g3_i6.p1  ORF type:complete len:444 (+),score=123.29 TRINITY_DN1780_c0_g3_i6:93-1424(+)
MSKTKLNSTGAQRMMLVLDECSQKIGFLSLLTKEILSAPESFKSLFGSTNVANLIVDLRQFEESYQNMLQNPSATQEEKDSALLTVHWAVRNLARALRDNPNLIEQLKNFQTKSGVVRNPSLKAFLGMIEELKDMTYQQLITTIEEEDSKNSFLGEILAKEQKVSSELKSLQTQLSELRSQREKEASQRINIITKLKEEIQEIQAASTNQIKHVEKETKLRETVDMKGFKEIEGVKKEELDRFGKSLDEKVVQNKKKEYLLRKKKFAVERELENWVAKYDQDMEEKEAEIDGLATEYTKEQQQLAEMEKYLGELEQEYEKLLSEEKKEEASKQRETAMRQKIDDAARIIQKAWKAYLKRKGKLNASTSKKKKRSKEKGKNASPPKSSPSQKSLSKSLSSPSKPSPTQTLKKPSLSSSSTPSPQKGSPAKKPPALAKTVAAVKV